MSSADTTSCPGLLQNLDVFGIVAYYLPIPALLHCAQTCHLANIQVRREIRSKLSQFLAAYFDPLSGVEALEINCAYYVGASWRLHKAVPAWRHIIVTRTR